MKILKPMLFCLVCKVNSIKCKYKMDLLRVFTESKIKKKEQVFTKLAI